MEYVERGSLEDRLEEGLPSVPEAVTLAREIATALVHAHAKGILHCDLKPANVLLDQDDRPRLADFGQSRLSHEQEPALGTLFYMAPEQADLNAVPDARWDVYALGALLYRMLTGQPPYRTEEAFADIQKAGRLEESLRRYRDWIARSPRPRAHRQVRGVDRALADIIDRCLAVRPDRRYPTAQSVLDALDQRALGRARRPLLILGAAAPALLALVIGLFAYHGLRTTVYESEQTLTERALLSDRFAAQSVAEEMALEMDRRWSILEAEAGRQELSRLLRQASGQGPDAPPRRRLQEWLETQHGQYPLSTTSAKAWLLLDAAGNMLAVSPLEPARQAIDRPFAYRSYFHGGGRDYSPDEMKNRHVEPTDRRTLSIAFQSTREHHPLMVVFSVPVREPAGAILGVLGMGVILGDFVGLQPGPDGADVDENRPGTRVAVLVDTRRDGNGGEGLILQHPWLWRFDEDKQEQPRLRLPPEVVARLKEVRRTAAAGGEPGAEALFSDYHDPVRAASRVYEDTAPWSASYDGPWLAAAGAVVIAPRKKTDPVTDTGWVVLVQERGHDALSPVRQLQHKLIVQGVTAAVALLIIVAGCWAFVLGMHREASRSRLMVLLRRRAGLKTGGSPGSTGPPGGAPRAAGQDAPTVTHR
jgi:hypothetical protein